MDLPVDCRAKVLVFGRNDSGKSTFAIEYATSVLRASPEGVCLVFSQKSKAERKPVKVDEVAISDRILYKWIGSRIELVDACARLHEFAGQPLELLIVEDIGEFLLPGPTQVLAMVALLANAVSVFPACRLLVTMTPRAEIVGFRMLMTHYVNTCGESRRVGRFPKSLPKANEEIMNCLSMSEAHR